MSDNSSSKKDSARELGGEDSPTQAQVSADRFEIPTEQLDSLTEQAAATVQQWLEQAGQIPEDKAGERLALILKDRLGLEFAVGFVDGVIRPEDNRIAAATLRRLSKRLPKSLPWYLRLALRLGGITAPIFPWMVVPIARRALRSMVAHLVVDARPNKLTPVIKKLHERGFELNVNLLGEMVLGHKEAERRLSAVQTLLGRPDIDYVSVKVSSVLAPHSRWSWEENVERACEQLLPLYRAAAADSPAGFINLDMEEYGDLDITVEVFRRVLSRPEFLQLRAGIVLQAYLPDALPVLIELTEWAKQRVADGGAPIKVRLVKGANLPMERVEADLHGWPLAVWGSKQESDTHYKRMLSYMLHPDRLQAVNLGVAGHNLFDIAFAYHLAKVRGCLTDLVSEPEGEAADQLQPAAAPILEFEMLLGMASAQVEAVRRQLKDSSVPVRLYTPVVYPQEFDVAIAYLVRRLDEGASSENFMSAVFDLGTDSSLFERERDRFLAAARQINTPAPASYRAGVRAGGDVAEEKPTVTDQPFGGFANTPDRDPAVAAEREQMIQAVERARTKEILAEPLALITSSEELEALIQKALSSKWGKQSAAERAKILHRVGQQLEANRHRLIEVMVAEAGKTVDQADPEVSEAIDFAHYYAECALELENIFGAKPVPVPLTAVIPPWNFPVAIPAGSVLSALAAGSAVILKPAGNTPACGRILVECARQAGVPEDALSVVHFADRQLATDWATDSRVGRVIFTGGYETADKLKQVRPDLNLLGETSGKNSLIITPHADLDLAVRDLAYSAFGHAGQKCSAASLGILVGSVGRSKRFFRQLADTVESLTVAYPTDMTAQMGPMITAPEGKLLEALTSLERKEKWLVEPRQLDESGRLWTPGVRTGVQPGSTCHRVEFFGPVLGLMTAPNLATALDWQNAVDYGLTAGLHSLDTEEINYWIERVQAGNLYVNRGTTGAIVRRQPFGGWKKSAVGAGTKAGGPNYLIGLTNWQALPVNAASVSALEDDEAALPDLAETGEKETVGEAVSAIIAAEAESAAVDSAEPGNEADKQKDNDSAENDSAEYDTADFDDILFTNELSVSVLPEAISSLVQTADLSSDQQQTLLAAAADDQDWWDREFGLVRDISGLSAEQNLFRYRPEPALIRYVAPATPASEASEDTEDTAVQAAAEETELSQKTAAETETELSADATTGLTGGLALLRVVMGMLRIIANFSDENDEAEQTLLIISLPPEEKTAKRLLAGMPSAMRSRLEVRIEDDASFQSFISSLAGEWSLRVRLVPGSDQVALPAAAKQLAEGLAADGVKPVDVALYYQPVTVSGRLELLPGLKEQAISVTAHRFGMPLPDDVRVG